MSKKRKKFVLPFIKRGYGGTIDFSHKQYDYSLVFLYISFFCAGIFFLILLVRLFQLTIVKGSYYHELSDQNRIREIIVEPRRGKIIDRYGIVIAENKIANTSEEKDRILSKRFYYDGELFSHIIGYRQLANDEDLKSNDCLNKLKIGDKTGKKGIEKTLDCILRGKNGKKLIEVDAKGKEKKPLAKIEPLDGATVQLSIDKRLQKKGYEIMNGKIGALIAVEPRTGEILSLISSPYFNPEAFENNLSSSINQYFSDKEKPLFNRVTEALYPPGSVFKMVVSAGALEEKIITAKTTVNDTGFIEVGGRKFYSWGRQYGAVDGETNVIKALQRSNDIFYYKTGLDMGPVSIMKWAEIFGFQKKTGIEIEESIGIIPRPLWKKDILKEKWYDGDTVNLSIGQGYTLVTPLQVAMSVLPFASDGYYCRPTLIKVEGENKSNCHKLPISNENLSIIMDGMKKACEQNGTGVPFFDFSFVDPANALSNENDKKIEVSSFSGFLKNKNSTESSFIKRKHMSVGCKTGTAESSDKENPHSWFTVYAPYDNPEIAVTVLIEFGGEGSKVASVIAKDFLTYFFETKK